MWDSLGKTINNSFFFVIDKIIDLQSFFISQAWTIGRLTLFIAILSAGFNYAITGTGLKENVIKILKATVFFLVVIFFYPRIIGFITSWTWNMAQQSIYPSIQSHFNRVVGTVEDKNTIVVGEGLGGGQYAFRTFTRTSIREITADNRNLLWGLTEKDKRGKYTMVAPAAVLKIVFFIAGECFQFMDSGRKGLAIVANAGAEFGNALKGAVCGFTVVFTGIFALLEYLACFMEFMLVSSVGVLLLPLSIWEGSKFMSEKFIGAILGFFMKLLLCNIAILLLVYGFVSLFYIIGDPNAGFTGEVDQIVFILFVCLLFFYICKSAPGIAQSLLTGAPSLSATGAISAVGGAVAAAGAVGGAVAGAAKTPSAIAGGVAKAGFGAQSLLTAAKAASGAVKDAGGGDGDQRAAFMKSIGADVGNSFKARALGLTRSFSETPGQQFQKHSDARKTEGAQRGRDFAEKHNIRRPSGQP